MLYCFNLIAVVQYQTHLYNGKYAYDKANYRKRL